MRVRFVRRVAVLTGVVGLVVLPAPRAEAAVSVMVFAGNITTTPLAGIGPGSIPCQSNPTGCVTVTGGPGVTVNPGGANAFFTFETSSCAAVTVSTPGDTEPTDAGTCTIKATGVLTGFGPISTGNGTVVVTLPIGTVTYTVDVTWIGGVMTMTSNTYEDFWRSTMFAVFGPSSQPASGLGSRSG